MLIRIEYFTDQQDSEFINMKNPDLSLATSDTIL